MKNIEFKNIYELVAFNLKINKKKILTWGTIIFTIMALYMILFSSVQELASAKFEAMPTEILQFVGMENLSSMANYNTYFAIIFNLILVAVSIFIASFSCELIAKEEKSGTIELLNSLKISRFEIYIAKYLCATATAGIVLALAVISGIVCGVIGGGDTFNFVELISNAKVSSFAVLIFSGFAFLFSGTSLKLGSAGIASGVVLASYMLGYLGQILEDKAEFLCYFSPFISLNSQMASNEQIMISMSIYFIIYVACVIVGGINYNKRDLG